MEYRSAPTSDGQITGGTSEALLTRIQEGLATPTRPGTKARRCPCCGGAIRTGQRLTTIHGTSVHARCATRQG